jgi:hypothetical protein
MYVCMCVRVCVCKHYFFHTEKRCRRFYHVSQKSLNGFTNISYTDLPLNSLYISFFKFIASQITQRRCHGTPPIVELIERRTKLGYIQAVRLKLLFEKIKFLVVFAGGTL